MVCYSASITTSPTDTGTSGTKSTILLPVAALCWPSCSWRTRYMFTRSGLSSFGRHCRRMLPRPPTTPFHRCVLPVMGSPATYRCIFLELPLLCLKFGDTGITSNIVR